MSFISDAVQKRRVPPLVFDRKSALELLSGHEYGYTPPFSGTVSGEIVRTEPIGGGVREHAVVSFDTPSGTFSFPLVLSSPAGENRVPHCLFIFLNFSPDIPDKYYPEERIVREGFAVARIFYSDVTSDSPEADGLAEHFPPLNETSPGKIGLWAFAASRALDFCLSLGRKYGGTAVIGHSRLGKTALWCGAQDERFDMVCSNCSGCSGDAVTRGKRGEHIAQITSVFPFWFCRKYADYAGNEDALPFDQHLLLSLTAPRLLAITAATDDEWADPESEYLSCALASEAWEKGGKAGFIHPDRLPSPEEHFTDGNIGFYLRRGIHFLDGADWNFFMHFWKQKHGI